MEHFGKFCAGLLILAVGILLNSFVFMKLWNWHVVSAFNIHSLAWIESAGISTMLPMIRGTKSSKKSDEEEDTMEELAIAAFKQSCFVAFLLLLGWIILQFK